MTHSYIPTQIDVPAPENHWHRWWMYQRERFPLANYIPIIVSFSYAAIAYSSLTRLAGGLPKWPRVVAAFGATFLFFLQLRLADDFKDFEDDSQFRPYRPVPRGLITLKELAFAWAGCLGLQILLALWMSWRMLPLVIAISVYMLVMSNKYVVRILGLTYWVKRHRFLYRSTGTMIVPLIFLYGTACDWMVAGDGFPAGTLAWMLAASYLTGTVLEIGRKIRAPEDEERGVETYSALWGRQKAAGTWLWTMSAAALAAYVAARNIHNTQMVVSLLFPVILLSIVAIVVFLLHSETGRGKWIETMSCIWVLMMYLSLGIVPALLQSYGGQK